MTFVCSESDKGRIFEYISSEPEMNQFFYGDIESFGLGGDPVGVYAFGPSKNKWECLLLKYCGSYIIYSRGGVGSFDPSEAAAFLGDNKPECISGKLESVKLLEPYFPAFSFEPTSLCRLTRADCRSTRSLMPGDTLRVLGSDDVDELTELLGQIDEFSKSCHDSEKLKKDKLLNLSHGGIIWGAFSGGKLVSTAAITAPSSVSAMVVSVATNPEYRGRGLATAVVSALCEDCFSRGKKFLCLFYDNPAAARIYKRIGFKDVGGYAMLH